MSQAASKLFYPKFSYVSLHALNMSDEIEVQEVPETKIYLHEVPLQPELQKIKTNVCERQVWRPYTFVLIC